jgi:hypothetical protein
VFGLSETNTCVRRGDSGGPVLLPSTDPSRVYATGTIEGSLLYNAAGQANGPGAEFCGSQFNPARTQRGYYSPIFSALNGFGLSVLTG